MSDTVFEPLPTTCPPRESEARVLADWRKDNVFARSLEKTKGGKPYVFYEGPPTANGSPHYGHVLTRVMKDLFPRYRSMDGYHVERKAGWDTHGLPVETEVEKTLGMKKKQDIEAYGVEKFVETCKQSVWKYKGEWERLTERIGFWLDLEHPYVTYEPEYVDSVWWALKTIWDRKLLVKGYKVLPWCPVCQTGLSNAEVGLGYAEVKDPALTVAFKVKGQDETYVLAWTTTPWTLLSNVALVVGADIEYGLYQLESGRKYWLATTRADAYKKELGEAKLLEKKLGKDLVGLRYEPLFTFAGKLEKDAHKVVTGDFVEAGADEANAADGGDAEDGGGGGPTSGAGTGIVHAAPAFGQDDYRVCKQNDLAFVQLVLPDGTFTADCGKYAGKWIKDADPEIIRELKERKLVVKHDQYLHNYPHCWRTKNPLIYYARTAWFVETTQVKDDMVRLNKAIAWAPEHVRDGRFGKFLEGNRDWNVSRERYWATPMPVWTCAKCGDEQAYGSRAELVAAGATLNGQKVAASAIDPHRPYVDGVKVPCKKCGAPAERDPSVIDCWFDSGAMPFAQWGYPHVPGSVEKFERNFPANFICEAIDQTRGWFYTLHAISTLLFGKSAYERCLVLGHVLDKQGKKLSKSAKNYVSPDKLLDEHGADAMRWFFYSKMTPGQGVRFYDEGVKDARRTFLLKILQVYDFFEKYASIDGFDPRSTKALPPEERTPLDHWIVSLGETTTGKVRSALDAYDFHAAALELESFVDALSNWYVRRSRDRAWSAADATNREKWALWWTLWETLVRLAKLVAPFTPFLAEDLHRVLVRNLGKGEMSVHHERYPTVDTSRVKPELEESMALARLVAALGKRVRLENKLKVRQPLKKAYVLVATSRDAERAKGLATVIEDELNVKQVEISTEYDRFVSFDVRPNFKTLGKKLGQRMKTLQTELGKLDPKVASDLSAKVRAGQKVTVALSDGPLELDAVDVEVRLKAREGWAAAEERGIVVILDKELDESLQDEALVAELKSTVQALRKARRLAYEARIVLFWGTDSAPLAATLERALTARGAWLTDQTLATRIERLGPDELSRLGSSAGDEPGAVGDRTVQWLDMGDEGKVLVGIQETR